MVSSKDDLYRRPNFAVDGIIPYYFRRSVLPDWATSPQTYPTAPSPWSTPSWQPPSWPPSAPSLPLLPPGTGSFPALSSPPEPPRLHDVDPPEQNPYNDPDYNPNFLVTKNSSEGAKEALKNWLLAYFDRHGDNRSRGRFIDGTPTQDQPGPFPERSAETDASAPNRTQNVLPALGIVSGKPMPDWIVAPPIWNFRR